MTRDARSDDRSITALAPLEGASAVVTGGSRGIGLAIARALIDAGANVAMLARSRDLLDREAASLGARAIPIVCDLADLAQLPATLDAIAGAVGTPDLLVNNAGAFALGAMGALPVEQVQRLFALNLTAPYALANALVPAMRERGRGHVVTIGSVADRQAYPENAAYAASKFGGRGLHEVLREELRGSGVRVSLVSPGPTDTALWDPIDADHRPGFSPRAAMLDPRAVADAVLWIVTRPAATNIDELRLTSA